MDSERGIAYFPTGSPTYDFYGADRVGNDLFANCLLALDARTGKRLWHFQTVHHDLWDYDDVAAPMLITINHNGKKVDAVAMAGKTGFLYVFDRVTGQPIWPIERAPAPTKTERPRRSPLAHAAHSHRAAAFRPPQLHRQRHQPIHAHRRAARQIPGAPRQRPATTASSPPSASPK